MMNRFAPSYRNLALALMLAVAVSGCSTVKKFTGQRDDSILPGQREDILPPDQQTAKDPIIAGGQQASTPDDSTAQPCKANAPDCVSPIDQEGTGAESQ